MALKTKRKHKQKHPVTEKQHKIEQHRQQENMPTQERATK
jgi:hypothetical protein